MAKILITGSEGVIGNCLRKILFDISEEDSPIILYLKDKAKKRGYGNIDDIYYDVQAKKKF